MAVVVLKKLITKIPRLPVGQGNRRIIAPRFVQLFLYFILISCTEIMNLNCVTADVAAPTNRQKNLFGANSYQFAQKIFNVIATEESDKNVLLSPFSIRTSVGTVRFGATGTTARELDTGLNFPSNNTETTAQLFKATLDQYKNSPVLKIANRVFIRKGYELKEDFNNTIEQYLSSKAEEIDFSDINKSVETINSWISKETSSIIREIISPTDIDSKLQIVLVNGVYFKGEWKKQFNVAKTHIADFFVKENSSIKVNMMEVVGNFLYADLPDWDATVLEMPYKDTDLSMLILLPNKNTGLSNLIKEIKKISLKKITRVMQRQNVLVKLPKFRAEYSADLGDSLKQLGILRMFSPDAELKGILKGNDSVAVSKVIHKTYIDVDEAGTEAAAATATSVRRTRSVVHPSELKLFISDHPFFYIIHETSRNAELLEDEYPNSNTIVFMGSFCTSDGYIIDPKLVEHNEL